MCKDHFIIPGKITVSRVTQKTCLQQVRTTVQPSPLNGMILRWTRHDVFIHIIMAGSTIKIQKYGWFQHRDLLSNSPLKNACLRFKDRVLSAPRRRVLLETPPPWHATICMKMSRLVHHNIMILTKQ